MTNVSEHNPINLLIFQSTPFCNLDCSYCYLKDRSVRSRISDEVISMTIKRLVEADIVPKVLKILWHAGEPTVVGIDFYKKAFETIKNELPPNVEVRHCMQTNGTLIDQAWCDFIKASKFQVGISIDGPAFINDKYRVDRRGKATFQPTLNAIKLFKQNGMPINTISVLTDVSLDHAKAMFDFFKTHAVDDISFNVEEIEGQNKTSTLDKGGIAKKVRDFYEAFYTLCEVDASYKPTVREFDHAYKKIKNYNNDNGFSDSLKAETEPLGIITVTQTGDFGTFSPELVNFDNHEAFILGNVLKDKLLECVSKQSFIALNEEIQKGVSMCETNCKYYKLCFGGRPSNKYGEHGTFACDETMNCRLNIQIPFDVTLQKLSQNMKYK